MNENLKDIAKRALKRRKEILEELRILEKTLHVISKSTGLAIDLDKNEVVEE